MTTCDDAIHWCPSHHHWPSSERPLTRTGLWSGDDSGATVPSQRRAANRRKEFLHSRHQETCVVSTMLTDTANRRFGILPSHHSKRCRDVIRLPTQALAHEATILRP